MICAHQHHPSRGSAAQAAVRFISGVPNPGLPKKYPSYLKPIPVNQRDIEAALRAAIDRESPQLIKWLYSTWTAQADAIKYQEIRNALVTGEIDQAWLDSWSRDYAEFINERWWPVASRTMESAAGLMLNSIDGYPGSLRIGTEAISAYLRNHAAELIDDLTAQQKLAVRNVLNWGISSELGPDEMARYLRPFVGLNGPQSTAMLAYRVELEKAGLLSPEQIETKVQDYAVWLNRRRAATIAQTEVSNAFREGQLESMKQLVGPGGWLEGEQIVKTWRTAPGCCDECRDMGGETVPIDQPYSNDLMTAGAHPHCYCIDEYARMRASE